MGKNDLWEDVRERKEGGRRIEGKERIVREKEDRTANRGARRGRKGNSFLKGREGRHFSLEKKEFEVHDNVFMFLGEVKARVIC